MAFWFSYTLCQPSYTDNSTSQWIVVFSFSIVVHCYNGFVMSYMLEKQKDLSLITLLWKRNGQKLT